MTVSFHEAEERAPMTNVQVDSRAVLHVEPDHRQHRGASVIA
jgi:hypothetical protein